jgi:hypothetical protein
MEPIKIFKDFLSMYARKDLEGIAALLDDDVLLKDWNLSVRGKEAFLGETAKNFSAARTLEIEVVRLYQGPGSVAGEVHIVVDGKEHLWVVDILEFNAAGKIVASRSFRGIPD